MTQNTDLKGKAYFLSGASAGAGLLMATLLAQRGATVSITGRSAERGASALSTLRAVSDDVHFFACDANVASSVVDTIAAAVRRMGHLDGVISSGAEGVTPPTLFSEMTPEQLEITFKSRLMPRIYPVHAAIPHLRSNGGGTVVMIGTDAARHVTPGESMIGAAGAAVLLLTKALARELGRDHIRVNTVAMTITSDTPSWDRAFAKQSFTNHLFSKAIARFPAGRPPSAMEVARTATFLASPDSESISGQTISVNGGLSFGGW